MHKGIYLLFLYTCSSLAATTWYVAKKTSATIPMSTRGSFMSTTPAVSAKKTTTIATTTAKTTTRFARSIATRFATLTATRFATSTARRFATSTAPRFATSTAPRFATSTARRFATSTATRFATSTARRFATSTATRFATSTARRFVTSTATRKNTPEASPTPLPKSLSEKIDYQIYQTRLLTGIVDDNRLALKRLISMMSHLLDNTVNIITNHSIDDEKHHFENRRHFNQVIHHDNDTLHVSFGTDADPNRYPWTVALRGNDRDRCGGTLIDDQHVLTAAHCIGTRTTTVSLGSHLYDGGEEVKTSFYCVHNAYSSSNYYRNDIAIIRLVTPVTVRLPKRVATINLCNRSNIIDTTKSANTVHLWMVGWGLKNTSIEPNELQEAQVILADRSMCKGSSRYTDMCVQSRPNTNRMGACTGDSGSGLFQQTILTDQWCALGVASSSDAHICEQTQFTTYVQASSQDYVEWFKDVLDRKKTFDDLQKLERCKTRTWGQEFCRWYAC